MKIQSNLYSKTKEDARYIAEVATELGTISKLIENGRLDEKVINDQFEYKQLRSIKNAISNIYLLLDLHEVKGIADQIYNPEFKPVE